jgi:hypothetical protein
MTKAVRFLAAMSAVVFVGCSSDNHGGSTGTGGHSGGSQGNGGATVSSGGSGGSVTTGGTTGSAGTIGSGGNAGRGGNTGNGGNSANGDAPAGGATGGGGTGDAGGHGGTSAVSDAGSPHDTALDAFACPACPAMKCTYGSPVDGNGCTVCTCNPAPDGGADVPIGSLCSLPEGCPDAGIDTGTHGEAGARSDVSRNDAGLKCGNAVCGTGEYCCNPVMDMCAPTGSACAV